MSYLPPFPNAFTIHRLGSTAGAEAFPLGIVGRTEGDVYTLDLHPLRVADIADLFAAVAALTVFAVSPSVYAERTGAVVALRAIAMAHHVPHEAVDADTLVLPGAALPTLLTHLPHYDFHACAAPLPWAEMWVIENVLRYHDHTWGQQRPLLPHLQGASFFLSSHDDCYLHLEADGLPLLQQVFARIWQLYAGTVLFEASGVCPPIAPLPPALLATLWPANAALTVLRSATQAQGHRLRMGVSRTPFSFREAQAYPVDFFVEYDGAAGGWGMVEGGTPSAFQ